MTISTKHVDQEGYKRTIMRWKKLIFGEALRELLDFYGKELIDADHKISTIQYRQKV